MKQESRERRVIRPEPMLRLEDVRSTMSRFVLKKMLLGGVCTAIVGGAALGASLGAAPPDFALAGLAPPDAHVLIRIDFTAPHVGRWTEVVERMLSPMVGDEAIAHWQQMRTRCKQLGGTPAEGPCCGSLLVLRFDEATDEFDWTLASPLFDRTCCQQGLRDLGANVAANGGFRIGPNGPMLRSSARWILAAPPESSLAREMALRVEADERARSGQSFAALVQSLATAPIEIVVRTPDSDESMIAFSLAPTGAHDATVQVVGVMEESPLGVRRVASLDLALLDRLAKHACFAMIESGGEHLDPALMQLMVGNIDLMPPRSVHAGMTRPRIMVVSSEAVEVQGVRHANLPVACVALPLEGEASQAEETIDRWMGAISQRLVMVLGDWRTANSLAEPRVGANGVRHLDVGSLISESLGGQLLAHAFSLNWSTVSAKNKAKWMVVGSSEAATGRVSAVLQGPIEATNLQQLSMAGIARPSVLAGHLKSVQSWYAKNGGDHDDGFHDVLGRFRNALGQLDAVSWQFTHQTEHGFEGAFQLHLTQADVKPERSR